ncbi:hypothetical protein TIFTF001_026119 [Ficus carica]|uniref:Uncharacterized protein n=1 Tax=Ficus carica TaxID=3494 RepID=A0AA88APT0_FICCA|nr:hypothetical protein TIFTF001_026119 [Ficus carica]
MRSRDPITAGNIRRRELDGSLAIFIPHRRCHKLVTALLKQCL